jgi:hypothetical protein
MVYPKPISSEIPQGPAKAELPPPKEAALGTMHCKTVIVCRSRGGWVSARAAGFDPRRAVSCRPMWNKITHALQTAQGHP